MTTQEIIDSITSGLFSAFGTSLNTNPSEPMGQLIGIFAASEQELFQLADAVKAQIDLGKADGVQLDVLAKLFLATREQATASTMTGVTLIGVSGTTIPVGSQIRYEDSTINTDIFELISPVTIPVGETTVLGNFANTTVGDRQINITLPFKIVTQLQGWDSVNVAASVVNVGSPFEVDNDFRNRLEFSSSKNGTNLIDTLTGALLAVSGVTKASVYQYQLPEENAPIGTTGLTVGYFEPIVVVSASNIQDVYNLAAKEIWDNKPLGVISQSEQGTGSLNVTGLTKDVLGNTQSVNFSIAKQELLAVDITISDIQLESFNNVAVVGAIKADLIAYIEALTISERAIFSKGFCIAASAGVGYGIDSFTWGFKGGVLAASDITFLPRDYGFLLAADISITVQ